MIYLTNVLHKYKICKFISNVKLPLLSNLPLSRNNFVSMLTQSQLRPKLSKLNIIPQFFWFQPLDWIFQAKRDFDLVKTTKSVKNVTSNEMIFKNVFISDK